MLRYKTAEGKKENKFGFGGKPQGAAFARKIVDPWQILATTKACQHIQGGRSISLKASSGALAECEAQLDKGFPQKSGPTKQETH